MYGKNCLFYSSCLIWRKLSKVLVNVKQKNTHFSNNLVWLEKKCLIGITKVERFVQIFNMEHLAIQPYIHFSYRKDNAYIISTIQIFIPQNLNWFLMLGMRSFIRTPFAFAKTKLPYLNPDLSFSVVSSILQFSSLEILNTALLLFFLFKHQWIDEAVIYINREMNK